MNFKLTKSSLNFKVYTSPTIPSSGAENDIVIISTTPMENWILSPDIPIGEPRNRGDVWIEYSVSGNVFDIMNQHDFMLAITRVYQYVDRTWVSVNARRYVGGVWDVVSSAFSATISITYPTNSTCTVTNSSGQTVANDTNTTSSEKTFTAIVSSTGTYTVTATATDGSGNSKSETVEITAEGQSVNVELGYNMVAFLDGKYRDIGSMSDMTLEDGELVLTATNYQAAWSFSDVPVDLSEYSTLHWDMKWVNNNGTNWEYRSCWIGLSATNTPVTNEAATTDAIYASQFAAYFKIYDEKTYEDVVAIDISTLTGKYYLCAFTNSWGSNGGTGNTILYSREIVAE